MTPSIKKQEEMKGKCTHCGKPMKEQSNNNWNLYCNEPECFEAFKKEALKYL